MCDKDLLRLGGVGMGGGAVINCHRNATVRWVGVEGGLFPPRGGARGSSSVTGIHSVVRASYLSASLNQFHAEVS